MRKVLLTLVVAVWAAGAGAQGISRVSEELARADFVSGARIEVRQTDDAATAVQRADFNPGRTSVMTYGVSLFRDNSQDARAKAYGVAGQFAELYPEIPVRVSYESPYFRVEAGKFVDRTDAVALCGRVLTLFRAAVIVQQEIPLAELITMEKTAPVIEIRE